LTVSVALDRLVRVLERLVPLAAALTRAVRVLLLASAASAVVIAVVLFRDGLPEGGEEVVLTAIGLAAAAAPPIVLLVLFLALRELLELPARVRSLPETGRERAAELGRLAQEAAEAEGSWWRVPLILWRLGAVAGSARELLTPWAPLLPLLSVPFLLLSTAAAAAAVLEVVVALAALASLAIF
jgi:hypothetical protein